VAFANNVGRIDDLRIPKSNFAPLAALCAKMNSPDEVRPHDPAGAVIAQGGESGGYCGDVSTMAMQKHSLHA
jgi:NAD(P)H-dependent flavin oxidoreductase YrpB (nitropropane dioxygenase family)